MSATAQEKRDGEWAIGVAAAQIEQFLRRPRALEQFDIARHYDIMVQLDEGVHEDDALSRAEVACTLQLLRPVPQVLFLPCFGTGRHIPAFLDAGVEHIIGVDLSDACVAKARRLFGGDSRVELHVGDLCEWRTDVSCDAAVLLGNSFADITDLALLEQVTTGMVAPLKQGGQFVMDFIATGYLECCEKRRYFTWDAILDGEPVWDVRHPVYDPETGIMTIFVVAIGKRHKRVLWTGTYQKRVMDHAQISAHFAATGVFVSPMGTAANLLHDHYGSCRADMGMLQRSTWFYGAKGVVA